MTSPNSSMSTMEVIDHFPELIDDFRGTQRSVHRDSTVTSGNSSMSSPELNDDFAELNDEYPQTQRNLRRHQSSSAYDEREARSGAQERRRCLPGTAPGEDAVPAAGSMGLSVLARPPGPRQILQADRRRPAHRFRLQAARASAAVPELAGDPRRGAAAGPRLLAAQAGRPRARENECFDRPRPGDRKRRAGGPGRYHRALGVPVGMA